MRIRRHGCQELNDGCIQNGELDQIKALFWSVKEEKNRACDGEKIKRNGRGFKVLPKK